MSQRLQLFISFAGIILILAAVSGFNFIVMKMQKNELVDHLPEREYNAIIARYHKYDAIVTGSSMSECTKCSEIDQFFGVHSHKFTLAACHISEVVTTLRYAQNFQNPKLILCDLNYGTFLQKEPMVYFPKEYYQINHFWTDFKDSFAISTLNNNLKYLRKKRKSLSLTRDDLYSWESSSFCGKLPLAKAIFESPIPIEIVVSNPENPRETMAFGPNISAEKVLFAPQKNKRSENQKGNDVRGLQNIIQQNLKIYLRPFLNENPNIRFIFFFPPYSLFGYYDLSTNRVIRSVIADELLKYKNVELYDFQSERSIIENLDLYKDVHHYRSSVNSWILHQIKDKKYLVTKENRKAFDEKFSRCLESVNRKKMLLELYKFYEASRKNVKK